MHLFGSASKYFAKDCFASVASPHDQVRFFGYLLFVE